MKAQNRAAWLLLAVLGALPVLAQAGCVGERAPTVKNEMRKSRAVVIGKVISTMNYAQGDYTEYTFQVQRQLKGRRVKTLVIHSENTGARFDMNERHNYLLFVLKGSDDKWRVDHCGNSSRMAEKRVGPTGRRY
jgi:hypothetical protein